MAVTLKQIAQVAGVSIAAVSKALKGDTDISVETRERIAKISKEMGYTPNAIARNLVNRKSNVIGVLIPNLSTPIYPLIFRGISEGAMKHNYTLLIGETNRKVEEEKKYVRTLLENRVSGIIMSPVTSDIGHIIEIVQDQIPIVYFGGKVNDTMRNYVGVNNILGSQLATEYLVGLGHKNITMLSDNSHTKTRHDRIQGYNSVMHKHGLKVSIIIDRSGLRARECGYHNMKKLLEPGRDMPTAIIASNDEIAIGVMEAALENNLKIPEDLSVVGYDDIEYASLPMINLSTVSQPKQEVGNLTVELLQNIISGENPNYINQTILDPELIIRGTCLDINNSIINKELKKPVALTL